MSGTRVVGVVVCVLLFGCVAQAEVEIVSQTLDYTYSENFYVPGAVDDHQPHYRGMWEDWGWTHDMSSLVPAGATGVEWATLWIDAWDVDLVDGEIDAIYINDVPMGILADTNGRNWVTSRFTLPPSLLDDLWQDGELYVYMDIDTGSGGHRVALDNSVLTVSYFVNAIPEPATLGLLGLGGLVMLKRRRRKI